VKGFILGVICTLIFGAPLFALQTHHGTLDPCRALDNTLQRHVASSIQTDVREKTDGGILGQMANTLLQPVAKPLIAEQTRKETADKNWFECGIELARIDFLGERDVHVDAIKQRLMSSLTAPATR
jgi:hypothetical protein